MVRSIITYNSLPHFKMNKPLMVARIGHFNTLRFRPDRYRRKAD